MSEDNVERIAEGRVWTGSEAFENGLIDEIGTIYDAIRICKEKVSIDEKHSVRLIYYPKERSILDEIFNFINVYTGFEPSFFENGYVQIIQIQNRPLALLPFKILWN
jgi:protease-4